MGENMVAAAMPKKYRETGVQAFQTIEAAEELKEQLCNDTGEQYEVVVDDDAGLAVVKVAEGEQEKTMQNVPRRYQKQCVKVFVRDENDICGTKCEELAKKYILDAADVKQGKYYSAKWHTGIFESILMILDAQVACADGQPVCSGDVLYAQDNIPVTAVGHNVSQVLNPVIIVENKSGQTERIPCDEIEYKYKHTLWSKNDRLEMCLKKFAAGFRKNLPLMIAVAVVVTAISALICGIEIVWKAHEEKKAAMAAARQAQVQEVQEQQEQEAEAPNPCHVHEVKVESLYKPYSDSYYFSVKLSGAEFYLNCKYSRQYRQAYEWFSERKGKTVQVEVLDNKDTYIFWKTGIRILDEGGEDFTLYQPLLKIEDVLQN